MLLLNTNQVLQKLHDNIIGIIKFQLQNNGEIRDNVNASCCNYDGFDHIDCIYIDTIWMNIVIMAQII